jgi:hypothetical protein
MGCRCSRAFGVPLRIALELGSGMRYCSQMKMRIAFLVPFASLCIHAAVAAERIPNFPKRTPYVEARESLVGIGWQPVTLPGATECLDGDDRCKDRPEVYLCSGTGLARCTFTWKRRDTLIEVQTFGEEDPMIERVRCRAGCR